MKYKKFSETHNYSIVHSSTVVITVSKRTVNYYTGLGYKCSAGDNLVVPMEHLLEKSNVLIHVRCPACLVDRYIPFFQLNSYKRTVCITCAKTHNLRGRRFGRLLVTDFVRQNGKTVWDCLCDCGKRVLVQGNSLMGNRTTSCGCLKTEKNKKYWTNYRKKNPDYLDRRGNEKYIEWRASVWKRDKYICQCCGCNKGNIVAHHLNSFSDYPEQRFSIENGVTLCRKCHYDFHIRFMNGWNKPNNAYDYHEWIDSLQGTP